GRGAPAGGKRSSGATWKCRRNRGPARRSRARAARRAPRCRRPPFAAHFTLVRDSNPALEVLRILQLVEDRDGEVLGGDVAPALLVDQQLIAAGAVFAGPLAGLDHGGGAEVG